MRKFFTYLTTLLFLTACDNEEVKIHLTENNVNMQPVKVDFTLMDIDFLNKENGFVIDNNGRVLSTEDSGTSWNELYNSDYELIDIHFIDSQNGYVLAKIPEQESYYLLKTNDFGETFQESAIPGGTSLTRLYFTNENVGFALGDHILRTGDGGLEWSELDLDFNVWRDMIEMENGELFTCGLYGSLLKSTDAGLTWEQVDLGINSHLYDIKPYQDLMYFLGQKFVKTNIQTTNEYEIPAYIRGFNIYNSEIIVGFGEQYPEQGFFPYGAMFISNNSGKDWETTIFYDFNRIRVTDFIDSSFGFAVADDDMNGVQYLLKINIEE